MDFNWTLFAQYLILGVTNGALIALIALGYTLVYGIVELINFAHGEVFMMGAFLSLTAVSAFGLVSGAGWAQIALVSLVACSPRCSSAACSTGVSTGSSTAGCAPRRGWRR